ncbi:MAG: hypothetical protein ACXWUX_08460 [Allosphingosinicella sp.]
MVRRFFLVGLILLAGCARSEDASVVANSKEFQVERVRSPERDDEAVAIGAWRETLQDESRALEFGPAGAPPLFSLRCDARRSMLLQRHGGLPPGDLPMMLLSIGSETRRLAVTSVDRPVAMVRASLPPSDTLLGTLATTSTPINVRMGDSPPLVLPPDPLIGTYISRCEDGAQAPATAGNQAESEAAAENEQAPTPAPAPAPPGR